MIYPKSLWEFSTLLASYEEEYSIALDKLDEQAEAVTEACDAQVADIIVEYAKKLQGVVKKSNLAKIIKQAEDIQKEMQIILGNGTPDLEAMGIDLGFSGGAVKGIDHADPISALAEAVAKLNVALRDLSTIDLEAMTPPETVQKSGSGKNATIIVSGGENEGVYTYDDLGRYTERSPQGIAGPVCIVWALCQEVIKRAEKLQEIVDEACDEGGVSVYVEDCASDWCSMRRKELARDVDALFEELYGEGSRSIDPAFYAYYDSARGEACDPYMDSPFSAFKDKINLGSVEVGIRDSYFDFSTKTPHVTTSGKFDAPLVLDLKNHGNLFCFVEHNQYDEATTAFLHQAILQYLAAAPAGKMKLCLVDVENKLSLSPYKLLDKVDPSILFKGIIRDDRQLEDIIKDMEQIMYRISDDVLSFNGVKDIFEYNAKFADAPECMHLFVLVNYSKNMDEALARRIQNIMERGNRCGIYTIVTTCEEEPLHPEDLERANPLYRATMDSTIGVGYNGDVWVAEGENLFTPVCQTVQKDKVSISRLPALVEQMTAAKK